MPDPNHVITPDEQAFYDAIFAYYQTPEQAMARAAERTEAQANRAAVLFQELPAQQFPFDVVPMRDLKGRVCQVFAVPAELLNPLTPDKE